MLKQEQTVQPGIAGLPEIIIVGKTQFSGSVRPDHKPVPGGEHHAIFLLKYTAGRGVIHRKMNHIHLTKSKKG